jgi:hypothetical protein
MGSIILKHPIYPGLSSQKRILEGCQIWHLETSRLISDTIYHNHPLSLKRQGTFF